MYVCLHFQRLSATDPENCFWFQLGDANCQNRFPGRCTGPGGRSRPLEVSIDQICSCRRLKVNRILRTQNQSHTGPGAARNLPSTQPALPPHPGIRLWSPTANRSCKPGPGATQSLGQTLIRTGSVPHPHRPGWVLRVKPPQEGLCGPSYPSLD